MRSGNTRRAQLAMALAATAVVVSAPVRAPAQDQSAALQGRAKANVCETCHGLDGLAKIPEAPNIAGQNPQYLVEQLRAFKSGQRSNPMMSIVAQDLSYDDIDQLAAYYSSIEITVGKIPGG